MPSRRFWCGLPRTGRPRIGARAAPASPLCAHSAPRPSVTAAQAGMQARCSRRRPDSWKEGGGIAGPRGGNLDHCRAVEVVLAVLGQPPPAVTPRAAVTRCGAGVFGTFWNRGRDALFRGSIAHTCRRSPRRAGAAPPGLPTWHKDAVEKEKKRKRKCNGSTATVDVKRGDLGLYTVKKCVKFYHPSSRSDKGSGFTAPPWRRTC